MPYEERRVSAFLGEDARSEEHRTYPQVEVLFSCACSEDPTDICTFWARGPDTSPTLFRAVP